MNTSSRHRETALIVRACSKRDEEAFVRLVEIHQAKVRGFLHRLCRNHANADDLAQETFMLAYQKLASYRASGSFEGWLCSIAYRCFLQHKRRQQREEEINQQYAREQSINPEYYEALSAEQLSLENAMRQLDRTEAAAITLCCSYGFSHREASAILALPLGTVKSHINRGTHKLRSILSTLPKEKMS